MNSISQYFYTDWSAMTFHDWLGLIITIIVFALMIFVYLYVFNPANKDKLEARRYLPLQEDELSAEDKK